MLKEAWLAKCPFDRLSMKARIIFISTRIELRGTFYLDSQHTSEDDNNALHANIFYRLIQY